MKKENWYKGLSLADDKFVAEADPANKIKPKRFKVITSIVAACACLALVFCSFWVLNPPNATTEMPEQTNNSYFNVIEKLSAFFDATNNSKVEVWGSQSESDNDGAPTAARGENYQEITDNQVEGIIEADRIKRSDKYIYYLDKNCLRVFSIDKENTKEVGNYAIKSEEKNTYYSLDEFFLSADCKTATVICTRGTKRSIENSSYYKHDTVVISLDVSNPKSIAKKDEFTVSGLYVSSRKVNGSILLITKLYLPKFSVDFNDETTYIPQIDTGNGEQCIPASCIVCPDNLSQANYTIVTKLDEHTLELKGNMAYLSYTSAVYVSNDNLFLTHSFENERENLDGTITQTAASEIACLNYNGDTLIHKGSVTVKGRVLNQWSMDEYNNILRVFTTTSSSKLNKHYYNDGENYYYSSKTEATNASLYCIDLSSFKVIASVIDFAPQGESVRSARFDKDMAYVCTSINFSDPVFFFDLSDLKNITYKETGTIEGFSSSLVNFGNGYLLGIGNGEKWNTFKVEVYKEAEDKVVSVCSYELQQTDYAINYKSYYIDRKNQLIGVGIFDYNRYKANKNAKDADRYIVLQFKENKLIELVNTPLEGTIDNMRGVYIDGYMYMFGENVFKVEKIL